MGIEFVSVEFFLFSIFVSNAGITCAAIFSLLWVHSSLQRKIEDLREDYELQILRTKNEHDGAVRELQKLVQQLAAQQKASISVSSGSVTSSTIVGGDVTTNNH